MREIRELKRVLGQSESVVFFGGAGVSTASGIPDFRSSGAFEVGFEEVLSAEYFRRNPEAFFEFYRRHMLFVGAKPNVVHEVLAQMEREGRLSAIITQNVDGLHQKAGSKNVVELHGNADKNFCMKCGKRYDAMFVGAAEGIPRCTSCGGMVRPNVVLYGEPVPAAAIQEAEEALYYADTLLVCGTSLAVYPASALVMGFEGENLIIINQQETDADGLATLRIFGDLVDVFEALSS